MKRLFLFLLATASVGAGACCSCRQAAKLQQPLEKTSWHLIQIMARDVVPTGDSFTLMFDGEGNASGVGACNSFMAQYTTTPQRALHIDNIASTRMMCPNQSAESEYFDVLDRATHYEMDADKMLLLSNGELIAIFQAKTE